MQEKFRIQKGDEKSDSLISWNDLEHVTVMPDILLTLVFARPCGDNHSAHTLSLSPDMPRQRRVGRSLKIRPDQRYAV